MKLMVKLLYLFLPRCLAGNIPEFDQRHGFSNQDDFLDNYISIEAISSKEEVKIAVDSQVVIHFTLPDSSNNEPSNGTNGLHLATVNPRTGLVTMKRLFATHFYAEDVPIYNYIASFLPEDIIILAVKYDAGLNLSKATRKLFQNLGSRISFSSVYRCYFVWIFSKNGKTWIETIIDDDPSSLGDFSTSPVRSHILITKIISDACWTSVNRSWSQRVNFCYKYSGYGRLCDCYDPAPIRYNPPEIENSVIADVPILIIAKNRPQSLYRCLVTLLRQPGGFNNRVIVILDNGNEEIIDLLNLLQISYNINDMASRKFEGTSARISAHYKYSLNATFHIFPKSQFVIVLEEDILVAPDFLSYFNQTAQLLLSDQSLYCVNAWNDLTAMHTFGDPHKVMRVEVHPGCGWMITKNFFEDAITNWVTTDKNFDWDVWFRGPWIRGSRECIIPEVSRTFHLSDTQGAHVTGAMTYSHFVGRLTTTQQLIKLNNINRLQQSIYEEDLYNFLESDQIVYLDTKLHPCHPNYIPRNYTEKAIVIFVAMNNLEDHRGWQRLALCLGIWHLDSRSHHRGLFRFSFYDTRIFVIGYPYSDYSYVKPPFIRVLSAIQNDWDLKYLAEFSVTNRARFRVPEFEEEWPIVVLDKPKAVPVYVPLARTNNKSSTVLG